MLSLLAFVAAMSAGTSSAVAADDEPFEIGLSPKLHVGAGFGRRALRWASAGETLRVDTGMFAAVEVGVAWPIAWSPSFALGPTFNYRTSLAKTIDEPHVTGPADRLRIRAHRLDAALEALLGHPQSAVRVALAVGYATNNLRPEVHHLQTPSYSLAGPFVRLGARLALGSRVALSIAPEATFLLVGNDLEERGLAATGFGIGGEVMLSVSVTSSFLLALSFSDQHAWVAARAGEGALDNGQLGTLRLVWQP